MRVTASSMRAIGISPDSTCLIVLAMKAFQSSGTMNMSLPALTAWAQLSLRQPFTSPMPFQSVTTKPSKPILFLRMSVTATLLPCSLPCSTPAAVSVQLLNEVMTVWAPALSAGT